MSFNKILGEYRKRIETSPNTLGEQSSKRNTLPPEESLLAGSRKTISGLKPARSVPSESFSTSTFATRIFLAASSLKLCFAAATKATSLSL